MKRLTILTSVLLITLLILSDGCNKEEDKVLNKITISGNANTEINGDYIPATGVYNASYLTGCNITMYQSGFIVTFSNGAAMMLSLFSPTSSVTIPTGTIQPQGGTECAAGFFGYFTVNLAKGGGYGLTGGSITINKTGLIYNVDINIQIDDKDGGGNLTGNFNGEMSPGTNK
jgi:hypothetical protein